MPGKKLSLHKTHVMVAHWKHRNSSKDNQNRLFRGIVRCEPCPKSPFLRKAQSWSDARSKHCFLEKAHIWYTIIITQCEYG